MWHMLLRIWGGSEIHSMGIALPNIISESDVSISEFERNLRVFFRIYVRDRRKLTVSNHMVPKEVKDQNFLLHNSSRMQDDILEALDRSHMKLEDSMTSIGRSLEFLGPRAEESLVTSAFGEAQNPSTG